MTLGPISLPEKHLHIIPEILLCRVRKIQVLQVFPKHFFRGVLVQLFGTLIPAEYLPVIVNRNNCITGLPHYAGQVVYRLYLSDSVIS